MTEIETVPHRRRIDRNRSSKTVLHSGRGRHFRTAARGPLSSGAERRPAIRNHTTPISLASPRAIEDLRFRKDRQTHEPCHFQIPVPSPELTVPNVNIAVRFSTNGGTHREVMTWYIQIGFEFVQQARPSPSATTALQREPWHFCTREPQV